MLISRGRLILQRCVSRCLSSVVSHDLSAFAHVELAPHVYSINSFFDAVQCARLIEDARSAGLRSSKVASDDVLDGYRTSTSAYLTRSSVQWVLDDIANVLQVSSDNFEDPQVTRYTPGQQYQAHLDTLDPTSAELLNGGQRVATFLVYLNDCPSGITSFPHHGINVVPRVGNALLFFPSAIDGTTDKSLLHAAKPVAKADKEKWVVQVWVRQRSWLAARKESNRFDAAVGSLAVSNAAVIIGALLLFGASR
jgi:prolyl 4-hydroxylase